MNAKAMKKESMKSRTDWKRIKEMKDEDIDLSEAPELDETFFKEAVPWPERKKQVTLRLDAEVLEFFREKGKGYQTAINNVLRRYVDLHKHNHGHSGSK